MVKRGCFIYDDTEVKAPYRGGGLPNPNKAYVRHYGNYLELQFIVKRTEGVHRFQANKELAICETKLEWWSKRPGFDLKVCLPEIANLKRQWEVSDVKDRWS